MTVNEPVMGFIAMALAIAAILAVGTLVAADIIHPGTRRPRPLTREPETSKPADDPTAALVPLGSSVAAGATLRANTGSASREGVALAPPDSTGAPALRPEVENDVDGHTLSEVAARRASPPTRVRS